MSLDYRPDWPPSNNILSTAAHVIPDKYGQYRTSFCALSVVNWATSPATSANAARFVRKADGTPFFFIGAPTKLFEWNSSTLFDVGKAPGGAVYSGTSDWWFCQFGDETLACNYADTTQTRSGAAGSRFADHATAPKAKIIGTQSGHVLAYNYNDGSAVPNGIKWSSQGSSAVWTAAVGNSAGSAKLIETPGEITAAAELHDIVVVWKRNSMYIGKRIGGAEIWRFNMLSPKIGCANKEAWTATPVGIIFVSPSSGVYKFDGSTPVPIDEGVRNDIYANFASAPIVKVSHDEASGCVYLWNMTASTTTVAWTYNYISDKWSKGYNSSLGVSSLAFVCAVRDANYDDYISMGAATTNGARRSHLIVGSDWLIYNMAGLTPANSLSPSLVWKAIRHPKAGLRDGTRISRVSPVWNASIEQAFLEPSSGTLTQASKDRPAGPTTANASATLDAAKGFDLIRTANTHALQMDFTNEALCISDLMIEMALAGTQ